MLVLASLCAGLGAISRFLVDDIVTRKIKISIPFGTFVVNVSACILVGFLSQLAILKGFTPTFSKLAITGFLGGYSTFSTAMIEGIRLLQEGRPKDCCIHTIGMFAASCVACICGVYLAHLIH